MTTSEKIGYMTDKLKGYKERASQTSDLFRMDGYCIMKQRLSFQFYKGAKCCIKVADFGNQVDFMNDIDSEVDDLYNAFIEREPLMEEYVAKSEASKRAELEAEMEKLKAQLEQ